LETTERGAMIASECVACRIARATQFVEQLGNFPRDNPMILQPPQEIILRLLRRGEQANPCSGLLGQQLGELPQFQQTGVGIIREILFCQHAEPQELTIILLQMREIGLRKNRLCHRAMLLLEAMCTTEAVSVASQISADSTVRFWSGQEK